MASECDLLHPTALNRDFLDFRPLFDDLFPKISTFLGAYHPKTHPKVKLGPLNRFTALPSDLEAGKVLFWGK